ncbi:hypothetical protein, partial [Alicyclobacillus sacchari]|uniref:hypothetical protein n=1 Tax=Alicyclobacillus sacchari TaxID=392010 RepID=UPI001AB0218B
DELRHTTILQKQTFQKFIIHVNLILSHIRSLLVSGFSQSYILPERTEMAHLLYLTCAIPFYTAYWTQLDSTPLCEIPRK